MKIIAIAAVSKNGVIGKGLELPWNIPEDMKFFKDSTRGHIVLMGRKTLDALGKPLPNRENAVITRDQSFKREGVHVFHSLESAITHYKADGAFQNQILFVIGGAEIYKLSLSFLDEVWLTEIDQEVEGDIYFPFYKNGVFDFSAFSLAESKPKKDESSSYSYRFSVFLKKD